MTTTIELTLRRQEECCTKSGPVSLRLKDYEKKPVPKLPLMEGIPWRFPDEIHFHLMILTSHFTGVTTILEDCPLSLGDLSFLLFIAFPTFSSYLSLSPPYSFLLAFESLVHLGLPIQMVNVSSSFFLSERVSLFKSFSERKERKREREREARLYIIIR